MAHTLLLRRKHAVTSVSIYSTHSTGQIETNEGGNKQREKGTQTNGHSRPCVTSGCRQSEEVDEEEGSRMVFFGQLREAEPDRWSAPSLAFLHAGTGARRTGSFRGTGGGDRGKRRSRLGRESPFVVK